MNSIQYKIERSRRKWYNIIVKDGIVIAHVPLRMSDKEVLKVLEEKRTWIEREVERSRLASKRFERLKHLTHVMIFGQIYEVDFGAVKKSILQEGKFVMPLRFDCKGKAIVRTIKKLLKGKAEEFLTTELAKKPYVYKSFALSNARTKWASCTADNRLQFNWRIVCLPPVLIDYLIVHELCHTIHHNHSPAYWALVASHLPNHKVLRKQLKDYSELTGLYRDK